VLLPPWALSWCDGCGQAKEAVQKAKKMPGGDKANPDLTWVIQLCSGWSFKRERERLSPKLLLWDPGVHLTAWHLPPLAWYSGGAWPYRAAITNEVKCCHPDPGISTSSRRGNVRSGAVAEQGISLLLAHIRSVTIHTSLLVILEISHPQTLSAEATS
jgi:hypothetical protein